ncbi:MAG: response regulator, partial [Clostridiales bacterium]|nr:response regulator [Clostridiales bacterium]
MLKVLLADYNKTSLTYFAKMIDWTHYGFQIVSEATDGGEALGCFMEFRHDIVILDTDLPEISGIELAAKIKELSPTTIVIFLSSSGEFSAARSALQLNAFDYLLKHELERSILIEKLQHVKTLIEKAKKQNKYLLEGALSSCLLSRKPELNDYEAVFPNSYHFLIAIQNHTIPVIAEKFNARTEELPEDEIRAACYSAADTLIVSVKIQSYMHLLLFNRSGDCYASANRLSAFLEARFRQTFSFIIIGENRTFKTGFRAYALL